jgi:heme/copper-type cytochrome/quinol oxidase subunit 2
MPLFNWGAPAMGKVMTGHFWIYWAITIPLTILVIGIVSLFAINENRKAKNDIDNAALEVADLIK